MEVVKNEDGVVVEKAIAGQLPIPAALAKKLAPYAGQDLVFGVRPENINYSSSEAGREFKEFARNIDVEIAELLGNEYIVHSHLFGQKMIAKLLVDPANTIHIGAKLDLVIDFNKVAFFKVDMPEEAETLPSEERNKRIYL